eukprot:Nitzschia sp. Nitz4//scaffold152_size53828//42992//44854//NITZ4_006750-RA/size53828-augustus-gene-0.93-mRNA-1//1//CDS//3329537226//1055//frame0
MVFRTACISTFLFFAWIQETSSSWIDPDTPQEARKIKPLSIGDEREYDLVFSDEFNVPDRTFRDGDDPRWTALDKNDFTNNALHYYSPDAATTSNGSLQITLDIEPRDELSTFADPESKEFKSGMLQSWNKFCFTGGIIEYEVKLPKSPKVAGLWPAIWMMGNLGRATFVNSTEDMWPFSTNVCDKRTKHSQLVNSCWNRDEEEGMPWGRGRGAPEIDLLEVMMMDEYFVSPVLSTSLQVAPGVPDSQRPLLGREPTENETWYSPDFGENVTRNTYFYGTVSFPFDKTKKPYRTDSISANMAVSDDFYENFKKFRLEWEPPTESGEGGYIKWFVDGHLTTAVYGDDLQKTSQTEIPSEPMYLVMNLAVSKDWGFPDAYFKNCPKKCWSCLDPECACALPKGFCENMPTSLDIDSVRVYQPRMENKYTLSCSPPSRPTKEYILAHESFYKREEDEHALKDIQRGGGACDTDVDCGTSARGICSAAQMCLCESGWTGPNCLAADAGISDFAEIHVEKHYSHSMAQWLVIGSLCLCVLFVFQWNTALWGKPDKNMYKLISSAVSKQDSTSTSDDGKQEDCYSSYQNNMVQP